MHYSETTKSAVLSGILGLSVGDALGVPVEFMPRTYLEKNPVKYMLEYGTYHQPKGSWSDDTSMALCLLDSLADKGLDYVDIIEKFKSWYLDSAYTATGERFDIGTTTKESILNYIDTGIEPLLCGMSDSYSAGNGSLMRILPLLFYLRNEYEDWFLENECYDIIHNVSSLTHRDKRCHIACGIYLTIGEYLLRGTKISSAINMGLATANEYYSNSNIYKSELHYFKRLYEDDDFDELDVSLIKSSGYVIDSLEASLWCLLTSNSYSGSVLKAVNLGEDTDTIGSITGGLAGLYYGLDSIPLEWLNDLQNKDLITNVVTKYCSKKNIK